MTEEFQQFLRCNRFIGAAEALFTQEVSPLPVLEATRNLGQTHEEMLLLYALKEVNKLNGIGDVHEIGAAYWYWVKQLTRSDLATSRGNHSYWHEVRTQSALDNLVAFAKDSGSGDSVLKAAREFYGGRTGGHHIALAI